MRGKYGVGIIAALYIMYKASIYENINVLVDSGEKLLLFSCLA